MSFQHHLLIASLFLSSASIVRGQSSAPAPAQPFQTDAEPQAAIASQAVTLAQSAPAQAAAGVRIVRLSQVIGDVTMDRNTGRGYESAFANLPVIQSASLRTGRGVAEVELEDGSTMRLAPETIVNFTELARDKSGATQTSLVLKKGSVYVSRTPAKAGTLLLRRGDVTISPEPGSHLRLASADKNQLTVFHGTALMQSTAANLSVGKKNTLLFDESGGATQLVHADSAKTVVDDWDKNSADYHERNGNGSAFGGSGYGVSDLNYYGSFADLPGCGRVWRPYFASSAWDPYSNGSWAWYSGVGYSWVSPYPWGWAPFHSGSWQNCGGSGWGWHPGGQWTGLNNAPAVLLHSPVTRRPLPPLPGRPTVFPVSTKPAAVSGATAEQFVFRKDSAGLGVPRQTFGKLGGISSTVEHRGMANTSYTAPALRNTNSPTVTSAGVNGQANRQANSLPNSSRPAPISAPTRSSAPMPSSAPAASPVHASASGSATRH